MINSDFRKKKHQRCIMKSIVFLFFSEDNRAGLDGMLHRISVMRNRKGEIYGLTLRVGRSIPNNTCMIEDLLLHEDCNSFWLSFLFWNDFISTSNSFKIYDIKKNGSGCFVGKKPKATSFF